MKKVKNDRQEPTLKEIAESMELTPVKFGIWLSKKIRKVRSPSAIKNWIYEGKTPAYAIREKVEKVLGPIQW